MGGQSNSRMQLEDLAEVRKDLALIAGTLFIKHIRLSVHVRSHPAVRQYIGRRGLACYRTGQCSVYCIHCQQRKNTIPIN